MATEFTAGQMGLAKIVEEIGFATELEISFPPFRIDIYVRELHCGIEYDGYHTMKKRDRKRDAFLYENYKLPILRIVGGETKPDVRDKLVSFFGEWAESAKERQQI